MGGDMAEGTAEILETTRNMHRLSARGSRRPRSKQLQINWCVRGVRFISYADEGSTLTTLKSWRVAIRAKAAVGSAEALQRLFFSSRGGQNGGRTTQPVQAVVAGTIDMPRVHQLNDATMTRVSSSAESLPRVDSDPPNSSR